MLEGYLEGEKLKSRVVVTYFVDMALGVIIKLTTQV